jgi:uncharacterized HhH-GPD family protein
MPPFLTGDDDADELLFADPLALLIGMVLDQQIPMERAFRAPFELRERLGGTLDPADLAAMDPDALTEIFQQKPALHRFPRSMAARVQEVCGVVVGQYQGVASNLWESATSGEELLATLRTLPGFGEQKARIFAALLAKRLGVTPPGWQEVTSPYGETGVFLSVADIDSPEAFKRVRAAKQQAKAEARARSTTSG